MKQIMLCYVDFLFNISSCQPKRFPFGTDEVWTMKQQTQKTQTSKIKTLTDVLTLRCTSATTQVPSSLKDWKQHCVNKMLHCAKSVVQTKWMNDTALLSVRLQLGQIRFYEKSCRQQFDPTSVCTSTCLLIKNTGIHLNLSPLYEIPPLLWLWGDAREKRGGGEGGVG